MSYKLPQNYEIRKYVARHPLGDIYQIQKNEYTITSKCIICGQMDGQVFLDVQSLRYTSYLLSYEGMTDCIIIEDVRPLPSALPASEVKNLLLHLLHAIEVLKERGLFVERIELEHVYQTDNHYKLDPYNVCRQGDYKSLIQDVCCIGLGLLKEGPIVSLLKQYANRPYQKSLDDLIKRLEKTKVADYKVVLENSCAERKYKKNQILSLEMITYICRYYFWFFVIVLLAIIYCLIGICHF